MGAVIGFFDMADFLKSFAGFKMALRGLSWYELNLLHGEVAVILQAISDEQRYQEGINNNLLKGNSALRAES